MYLNGFRIQKLMHRPKLSSYTSMGTLKYYLIQDNESHDNNCYLNTLKVHLGFFGYVRRAKP